MCLTCKPNKVYNVANEIESEAHSGHANIYIDNLYSKVEKNDGYKFIRELDYKELELKAEKLKKFLANQVDCWLAECK